jgi:hypothetical protein
MGDEVGTCEKGWIKRVSELSEFLLTSSVPFDHSGYTRLVSLLIVNHIESKSLGLVATTIKPRLIDLVVFLYIMTGSILP